MKGFAQQESGSPVPVVALRFKGTMPATVCFPFSGSAPKLIIVILCRNGV